MSADTAFSFAYTAQRNAFHLRARKVMYFLTEIQICLEANFMPTWCTPVNRSQALKSSHGGINTAENDRT
jgi:ribonuclease I